MISEELMYLKNKVVPFRLVGGSLCLTELQIHESEWIREFVEKFREYFQYDDQFKVYWFKESK